MRSPSDGDLKIFEIYSHYIFPFFKNVELSFDKIDRFWKLLLCIVIDRYTSTKMESRVLKNPDLTGEYFEGIET